MKKKKKKKKKETQKKRKKKKKTPFFPKLRSLFFLNKKISYPK